MRNIEELMNAVDAVLNFSSEMIIRRKKKKGFSEEELAEVRNNCKILSENNVYPFELEGKNKRELFAQIQKFARHGIEKS